MKLLILPFLAQLAQLAIDNLPLLITVALAPAGIWLYRRISQASEAVKNARVHQLGEIAGGLATGLDWIAPHTATTWDDRARDAMRALADACRAAGVKPPTRAEAPVATAALVAAGVLIPASATKLAAKVH